MATLSDLLTAIDDYMQNNGGEVSYLANRMHAMFDAPEAPLNAKDGPLAKFGEKIKENIKKMEDFSKALTNNTISFLQLNTSVKNLNDAIKRKIGFINAIFSQYKGLQMQSIIDAIALKYGNSMAVTFDTSKLTSELSNKIAKKFIAIFRALSGQEQLLSAKPSGMSVNSHLFIGGDAVSIDNPIPVYLVGVGDEISRALWSVRTQRERPREESKGSGIIGKILKFLIGGVAIVGLAGFAKQFFESSPIGRYLLSNIKKMFSNLSKGVTDILQDPKTKQLFLDGVTGIVDTIMYFINGISNFITKNLTAGFDAVWNWLFKIEKADPRKEESTIVGKVVKFLTGWFILRQVPLLGTVMGFVEKMFGKLTWAILSRLPGLSWSIIKGSFSILGKTIGLMWKGITKIGPLASKIGGFVSRLGPLLRQFGPLGLAATAAVMAVSHLINKFDKFHEAAAELTNNIEDSHAKQEVSDHKESKQIRKLEAEADALRLKKNRSHIEDVELELKDAIIKRKKSELDLRKEIMEAEKKEKGTWGAFKNDWTGGVQKEVAAIQERHQKAAVSNDKLIQRLKSDMDKAQDVKKDEIKIQQDHNTILKQTLEERRAIEKKNDEYIRSPAFREAMERIGNDAKNIRAENVERRQVNDAIIVEPHSKDQILMAKKNGPIDAALIDLNSKFDTLAQAFAEGCIGIIQATVAGSNNVAQTVAASSGGGGGTPSPTQSGPDPIAAFRNKAREFLKVR